MAKISNNFLDIQHNQFNDLQGGKAENGAITEAYHMTEEEWRKIPAKPYIASPTNGAIDVNQVPQIQGSPYIHIHEVSMRGKHIQIATDNIFMNIIYEKEELSAVTVFQIPSKPESEGEGFYLTTDTTYYIRIRYQDAKDRWSFWSMPSSFKTLAVFPDSVITTPMMLLPASDTTVPASNPILGMSVPQVITGVANFVTSDWQVATDSAFIDPIYNKTDSPDRTVHACLGLNLETALGVEFYTRGRTKTDGGIYSPWAIPTRFKVKPPYTDPIFGFRRIFPVSNPTKYVEMYNIDREGNKVILTTPYFNSHPLYKFTPHKVNIGKDSSNNDVYSDMVLIPPVWEKNDVYTNSDGDMVIDIWFSPAPMPANEGWFLDPAFAKSPYGLLIGQGLSSAERTVGGVTVVTPRTGIVDNELNYLITITHPWANSHIEYTQNLNQLQNQSGWHVWTIFERRLIHDLMQAEMLSHDLNQIITMCPVQNVYRGMYHILRAGNRPQDYNHRVLVTGYGHWLLNTPKKLTAKACISIPSAPAQTLELDIASTGAALTSGYYGSAEGIMELYTGYRQHFGGLDAAVLGIPKTLKGNSPFKISARLIKYEYAYAINMPIGWCATGWTDVFGTGGVYADEGNAYSRLAKHITEPLVEVPTDTSTTVIVKYLPVTIKGGDNIAVSKETKPTGEEFTVSYAANTPNP